MLENIDLTSLEMTGKIAVGAIFGSTIVKLLLKSHKVTIDNRWWMLVSACLCAFLAILAKFVPGAEITWSETFDTAFVAWMGTFGIYKGVWVYAEDFLSKRLSAWGAKNGENSGIQ